MTVGGLAHHTVAQVAHVVRLLGQPPRDQEPISAPEHYARADWVSEDAEGETNVRIREASDQQAVGGPDGLRALVEDFLPRLEVALAAPRDPDTVHVPWQGWSLSTPDFLLTRMLELVVHSDDLAASVDLPTPEFPEPVFGAVARLLAVVSARRHGQAAVVRTLARPQRAPATVSAF
jgi:hypothetical protein